MKIHGTILDEIIEAQQDIRKLQKDSHKKYDGNIVKYLKYLEKDPNFNYIINAEPMQLLNLYEKKIDSIAEITYNPNFSKKQNALNVLEYNRIMSMYENVIQKTQDDKKMFKLNKNPIFLAFLGKGLCFAQAKFVRDIFQRLNINSIDFTVDSYKHTLDYSIFNRIHFATTVELDDNKIYGIDPTIYNGNLKSLAVYARPQSKQSLESMGIRTDFSATQEEIYISRNFVFPKLIKMLEIDKISKQLDLENQQDLQKQCTIITFIESRLNLTGDLKTKSCSANINGVNIEVGKLMELFFYQNNIEYSIKCDRDKRNSVYQTRLGQTELYLSPKSIFESTDKARIFMSKTHYFIKNGKKFLLLSLSAKMYNTYMYYINQGRQNVLYLEIKNICDKINMDINTFIQAPMENMKKYSPKINVDAFVMRNLVKSIETELPKNRNSKLTAQRITQGVAKVGTKCGMENAIKESLQINNREILKTPDEKYGRE